MQTVFEMMPRVIRVAIGTAFHSPDHALRDTSFRQLYDAYWGSQRLVYTVGREGPRVSARGLIAGFYVVMCSHSQRMRPARSGERFGAVPVRRWKDGESCSIRSLAEPGPYPTVPTSNHLIDSQGTGS